MLREGTTLNLSLKPRSLHPTLSPSLGEGWPGGKHKLSQVSRWLVISSLPAEPRRNTFKGVERV